MKSNNTSKKEPLEDIFFNISPEERERVFMKVIDGAISDQREILARAKRLQREHCAAAKPD